MARKRNVETEAKIAEAATSLFCENGYVDTTMAAIAERAGVSVQTLYLRHGSKSAILSAALDIAIVGDSDRVGVMERDFAPRAMEEPDLATAIAIWAHGARLISDRTHDLYDVIRSAAADPEVAEVLAKNRRERAIGHRAIAEALQAKAGYNHDVPQQRAADLLYALGTEDGYLLFVTDLGWSVDEWEQWVVSTAVAQLVVSG